MVNFGPLAAEIVSIVWGTPGNFNGFRVLSTLLQRRRSTEVNQTLHYVWPSPGLVRYIYTFGISCPLTEICHVQNSLCVHPCTIAQVSRAMSSQLRHLSTIGKKLLTRWRFLATFLRPIFAASRVPRISDMHSKFVLGPHHVWKYGRHPISGR